MTTHPNTCPARFGGTCACSIARRAKPIPPELAPFAKGQRVRFAATCRRPEMRGITGTVKQIVKSRGVVTVERDDTGDWYDAFPASLEVLP